MKRLIIVLSVVIFILSGCKQEKTEKVGYPISFDGVEFSDSPQRVVSLCPSVSEKLTVMGYKNKVVGDYQSFGSPSFPTVEEITSFSPDLVIGGAPLSPSLKESLDKKGIKTVVLPFKESDEEIYSLLGSLASIFEGSEMGKLREQQIRYFGNAYEQYLTEKSAEGIIEENPGEPPVALLAVAHDYAATPDTIMGQWLTDKGFLNAAQNYTDWYAPKEDVNDKATVIFCTPELAQNFDESSAQKIIPMDLTPLENQSPLMFLRRYEMIESSFSSVKFDEPECIMPYEIPQKPPLKWYEKILEKFS